MSTRRLLVVSSTAAAALAFTSLSPNFRGYGVVAATPATCASKDVKAEDTENLSMWTHRWKANNTRWHSTQPHASLQKHLHVLPSGPTLVPLCGKTVDLHYLASTNRPSVGVEGVKKAIDEYATEQAPFGVSFDADTDTGEYEAMETYAGTFGGVPVKILRGDFFDLQGEFTGAWDRAAFVAINPSMRSEYAKVLGRTVQAGGVILMSTYERRAGTPSAVANGPPFSVSEADVRETFGGLEWVESIEVLEDVDVFTEPRYKDSVKRWSDAGLTDFREIVLVIKVKGGKKAWWKFW